MNGLSDYALRTPRDENLMGLWGGFCLTLLISLVGGRCNPSANGRPLSGVRTEFHPPPDPRFTQQRLDNDAEHGSILMERSFGFGTRIGLNQGVSGD